MTDPKASRQQETDSSEENEIGLVLCQIQIGSPSTTRSEQTGSSGLIINDPLRTVVTLRRGRIRRLAPNLLGTVT